MFLPPSLGLNTGVFYALSTLLNRMVILHYPVRESPKHAGPGKDEVSETLCRSQDGGELSVSPGLGSMVWWSAYRIWRAIALDLHASSGGTNLCDTVISIAELSFRFLQKKRNYLLRDYF